jgi:NADH-quinone oxidoreductase subunit M
VGYGWLTYFYNLDALLMPYLSLLIFIPVITALVALLIPARYTRVFPWLTIGVNIIQVILFVLMLFHFQADGGLQLVEKHSWISLSLNNWGQLQAEYLVAVDGLSFPLVGLSVVIMLIATISSWHISKKSQRIFCVVVDSEWCHHW